MATNRNATVRKALRSAASYVEEFGGISPVGTGWDSIAYRIDSREIRLDRDLYLRTLHREISRLQR